MKQRDYSAVAMLDLLGFSRILDRDSLDEVERRFTQTLMSGIAFAGFASIGAFVFDERGNLDVGEDLWTVSFGVFSDTVVLYPRPLHARPFYDICKTVALLIDIALQAGWLFRGGIDFGTFRALPDHNLYIGSGLIRAHRLESSQDWAGAIVGEEAQTRYPADVAEMKAIHLLVDYPTPIKSGTGVTPSSRLAVNWCHFDMKWSESRGDKLKELLDDAPREAETKLQATIAFHDQMVSSGLTNAEQMAGRVVGDPTGADSITSRSRRRRKESRA